jgi:nitrous oxidase accessory protein NosD
MKPILILPLTVLAISILSTVDGRDITVGSGGDYSRIQDAIDDSSDGDVIWVMSGTYKENVDINKPISLEGWNTEYGYPIIDGDNGESAITLSADGITVESLGVINSRNAGIDVKSSNNNIVDIKASNNKYGILIEPSSSVNFIRSSNVGSTEVFSNTYGIFMDSSNSNIINLIKARKNNYGIYLKSSYFNDISGNDLVDNAKNDAHDDNTDLGNANTWNTNHYSEYDSSREGCKNPDNDGNCDAPYVIPGGSMQDDNPKNKANEITIPNRRDKENTSPPKKRKNN